MKRFVLLLTTAALLNTGCDSQPGADKERLSAKEFAEMLDEETAPQLLDVRSAGEFAGGHLEHAVNVEWGRQFRQYASNLDKQAPVYVYCLSGARSASAAAFLRDQGFEKVYEMPGGMIEWRADRLPEAGSARPAAGGLTLQQYEKLLEGNKLVLVDFYADWCGPCKKMEPYLKKMEKELADKMVLVRIDADENPELCSRLNVTALPTLKLYKNKELSWNNVGFVDESRVREQMGL